MRGKRYHTYVCSRVRMWTEHLHSVGEKSLKMCFKQNFKGLPDGADMTGTVSSNKATNVSLSWYHETTSVSTNAIWIWFMHLKKKCKVLQSKVEFLIPIETLLVVIDHIIDQNYLWVAKSYMMHFEKVTKVLRQQQPWKVFYFKLKTTCV